MHWMSYSIHVVHYEKGQRVEHDIEVDESKPFIPAFQDVEIKATPLKSRVCETLMRSAHLRRPYYDFYFLSISRVDGLLHPRRPL